MKIASLFQHNLRGILISLLDGSHTQSHVKQLIAISHSLAVIFVKRRIGNGSLKPSLIPLSPDDIAYDCIAELFERDEEGNFIQIQAYFSGIPVPGESDESLLIHLRSLVYTKVNNGIFRLYNEADPSLGKILRNIKSAVTTLNNFKETEVFGEHYITPTGCDPLRHLPVMENAYFEEHFSRNAIILRNVPALLGHLSLFLREQHVFRRSVTLIATAFVFRNIFARQELPAFETPQVEAELDREDARRIIREACAGVHQSMLPRYVDKKKVDASVFGHYFKVIEQHLLCTIVEEDGHNFSFFHSLQVLMPGLTEGEYAQTHKSILDYMSRCARNKTMELYELSR